MRNRWGCRCEAPRCFGLRDLQPRHESQYLQDGSSAREGAQFGARGEELSGAALSGHVSLSGNEQRAHGPGGFGAAMSDKPESFYVMEYVDGDECVLFHAATLTEARAKAMIEKHRDPRAELSVWSSKGGVIDLAD